MSDLVGCKIGDYQVLRKLGSGGMADVYAARQLKLQRDVALKVLRQNHRGSDEDLKRFRREAQAAARLNHPAIVQVYEIGDADANHFISQELIDGVNLSQWLKTRGQLSADDAIKVLSSVAAALQVAHAAGITHRDIKPENIMRAESDGTIKVTDFGLARMLASSELSTTNLTRDGLTLGTPRYMSPEQIQGHAVDGRSDLYSLGVTMYHLLAGRPPFDGDEPLALAVKHLHETPPPLDRIRGQADLPDWLVASVMRMLNKAPEDRFASAADLLQLIEHHGEAGSREGAAAGRSSDTLPLGSTSATIRLQRMTDAVAAASKNSRRRWWPTVAALLIGAVLGVGVVVAARLQPVDEILRGTAVPKANSIQEQFLVAMSRDDVAGWEAVIDFQADDPTSRSVTDYINKSRLHLARLFLSQNRVREAESVLNDLDRSGATSRLHQSLCVVLRYEIAKQKRDGREQTQLKESLRKLTTILQQENAAAMRTFNEVVPLAMRTEMGVMELPTG